MTFTQLTAFALVAELGSLKAAAAALGVSEPAVSAALTALRNDLGDPLFVRSGGGIALTAGGRALAGRARDLVSLADRARREVARAATSPGGLRVLACAGCAEHVAGLLTAFTARVPGVSVDLAVGTGDAAGALAEGRCDVTLGPRPVPRAGQHLDAVPFLRYQRVLVAAPDHPLTRRRGPLGLADLSGHRWLSGPAGIECGSPEERWLVALGAPPAPAPVVHRLDGEADAVAEVRPGRGILLALVHLVAADLRAGTLVRLPVAGTPVTGVWWATLAAGGVAPPAARALQRFLTTPDATTALLARPPRRERHRPVRVELWSS